MILPIRLEDDPVIRQVARPVRKFNRKLRRLMDDMLETMYDAPGVGLAGNQVGVLRRIVVCDVGEGPLYLVNPEITERSGSVVEYEGCLSVPGWYGEVERYQRVVVHAYDPEGRELWIRAEDFFARCLQHEVDHLNGVLYKDRALRMVRSRDVEREEGQAEASDQASSPEAGEAAHPGSAP